LAARLKFTRSKIDKLRLLASEIDTLKNLSLEGISLILPHLLKILEDEKLFDCEAKYNAFSDALSPQSGDNMGYPHSDHTAAPDADSNSHIYIANTAFEQAKFVETYILVIDIISSRLGPDTTNYIIVPKV
jgi:hypothetical protein